MPTPLRSHATTTLVTYLGSADGAAAHAHPQAIRTRLNQPPRLQMVFGERRWEAPLSSVQVPVGEDSDGRTVQRRGREGRLRCRREASAGRRMRWAGLASD